MTNPPHTAPPGVCPEVELLAAFADGRLEGEEKARLIEHLANCEDCRELVAESLAAAREIDQQGVSLPFPRPSQRRSHLRWLVAAGVAVALVGLWWFRAPASNERELMALAERGLDRLPASWSEARWSIARAEAPLLSDRARAFRLGARSVDLEVAAAGADTKEVRRLAGECSALLGPVPFAEPAAAHFREMVRGSDTAPLALAAKPGQVIDAVRSAREAVDSSLFDLGRWAETERLLAVAGVRRHLDRPPVVENPAPELETALAEVRAVLYEADPAIRAETLERLVARGGDLP